MPPTSRSEFLIPSLFVIFSLLLSPGWAKRPEKLPDLGLKPIEQSEAYQRLISKPVCERAKLKYLIDRFKNLQVDINYDGHYYKPKDIAGITELFMNLNYNNNQTARGWLMQYGSRTLGSGSPIWFRTTDGEMHQSIHVLLNELDSLEKLLPKAV